MSNKKEWEDRVCMFVNDAWNRGTNWAMKGFGYAMDTDADREAELTIELIKNLLAQAEREAVNSTVTKVKEWLKEWPKFNGTPPKGMTLEKYLDSLLVSTKTE